MLHDRREGSELDYILRGAVYNKIKIIKQKITSSDKFLKALCAAHFSVTFNLCFQWKHCRLVMREVQPLTSSLVGHRQNWRSRLSARITQRDVPRGRHGSCEGLVGTVTTWQVGIIAGLQRVHHPLKFILKPNRASQPRPQGLLAFQNGGGSGEDPGTQQITCLQRGWRCIQNGGYGEKGEKNWVRDVVKVKMNKMAEKVEVQLKKK